MKGLFGGQAIEDANCHLQKFINVCRPFKMNNISQKSTESFPIFSNWEATIWIEELPQGSVTFWDKPKSSVLERFFPPSLILKLRDEINNL